MGAAQYICVIFNALTREGSIRSHMSTWPHRLWKHKLWSDGCNMLECYRLFHYLLRQRMKELPPAERSLPNRAGPQARTQRTLRAANSIRNGIKAKRQKNTNTGSDIKTTAWKRKVKPELQFHQVAVRAFLFFFFFSGPRTKWPHLCGVSPSGFPALLCVNVSVNRLRHHRLTELVCFVSHSRAGPEPVQPIWFVFWCVCRSVVTKKTMTRRC